MYALTFPKTGTQNSATTLIHRDEVQNLHIWYGSNVATTAFSITNVATRCRINVKPGRFFTFEMLVIVGAA